MTKRTEAEVDAGPEKYRAETRAAVHKGIREGKGKPLTMNERIRIDNEIAYQKNKSLSERWNEDAEMYENRSKDDKAKEKRVEATKERLRKDFKKEE